jgi:DNA-directed RNA polymerase specialized sigma24 family protein
MTELLQMAEPASRRRPTPDRVLLERVARGDERAFGELYDRHHLSLYALAYSIVVEAADAEGVVTDVFDHVWLKAPQPGSIQGSAHTWLAAVTRSRARGVVRAREWSPRPPAAERPASQRTRHGRKMLTKALNKTLGAALALALPLALTAQTPQIPNSHASDAAKAKVAEHRHPSARSYRGSVENAVPRSPNSATPAVGATRAVPASPATPATPATPAQGESPATPATPASPATPAVPALPSHKPSNPGQSNNHRP